MTREENIKNLLTEIVEMIDNGSQKDLDRADEIATTIIKALGQEPCEDMERKIEKEYLFESLCEDLKKLQTENENLRKALKQEHILDKIIDDIQTLRGCSCGNSDGIIDDVEDIIDKYRQGK